MRFLSDTCPSHKEHTGNFRRNPPNLPPSPGSRDCVVFSRLRATEGSGVENGNFLRTGGIVRGDRKRCQSGELCRCLSYKVILCTAHRSRPNHALYTYDIAAQRLTDDRGAIRPCGAINEWRTHLRGPGTYLSKARKASGQVFLPLERGCHRRFTCFDGGRHPREYRPSGRYPCPNGRIRQTTRLSVGR